MSRVCSTGNLIKKCFNVIAHTRSQIILHGDTLYNIKRKKYKTVSAIRKSHLRQNSHDLLWI